MNILFRVGGLNPKGLALGEGYEGEVWGVAPAKIMIVMISHMSSIIMIYELL